MAMHGILWSCLACAPNYYLELSDKLQKQIFRTVGPLLAASLELLAYRQNVANLNLFCTYYFGRCSTELAPLGLLVIVVDCMIFLSPFLDVTIMSMSIISFLAQLDSGILCLQNALL